MLQLVTLWMHRAGSFQKVHIMQRAAPCCVPGHASDNQARSCTCTTHLIHAQTLAQISPSQPCAPYWLIALMLCKGEVPLRREGLELLLDQQVEPAVQFASHGSGQGQHIA